jgi:hypothetical protein
LHSAASELAAERSVANAKVERYRQRAEQEGAAAQEELELARQGCRRDQEAVHAAHAAAQQATKTRFDEELARLVAHAEAAQEARQRDMELEKAAYEQRLQEQRSAAEAVASPHHVQPPTTSPHHLPAHASQILVKENSTWGCCGVEAGGAPEGEVMAR